MFWSAAVGKVSNNTIVVSSITPRASTTASPSKGPNKERASMLLLDGVDDFRTENFRELLYLTSLFSAWFS